jgi:hypothetical protein
MAPITKFTRKTKGFDVDRGVSKNLGAHKHEYIMALILIPLN